MKIKTTKVKVSTACWLLLGSLALLIPMHSFGQTVIGSFQNDTGDGWINWTGGLSITNAANTNEFAFVPGAVPGYTQSLQVSATGYNQNLAIKLESIPGGLAAFLHNYLLTFTISVPSSASSGATAGYSQLNSLVLNASGWGYNAIPATNFTETGNTSANSGNGGLPGFYFYSGAPEQSQVVTINYSNILSSITATTNSGYIELIFVSNNGGGAPTNYFINNIVLSGAPGAAPAGTFVVDNFSPLGVGPDNATNYDYLATDEDYADGDITNVWSNWNFGPGVDTDLESVQWDPNNNATGNPNFGSMLVTITNNNQYVLFDSYTPFNVSALTYTNLQFAIKYAAGSAIRTNSNGTLDYGLVQVGCRTSTYNQDYFGSFAIPATNSVGGPNTNWTIVNIPLSAVTDTNQIDITDVIFHGYHPGYGNEDMVGQTVYWLDNIEFTGPTTVATSAPPKLAMSPAIPGLRIFAGSTAETYDREELATTDQMQSWVGNNYPVTYSFTLLNYPANINQTHIFLVPVNPSGQTSMGNAGTVNEYIEYNASNALWMVINPAAGGVTATIQWKVGLPGANPNNTALIITNATAVGTWTLTFKNASMGTLTAPGAGAVPFTIGDTNVATDFANPLVAYFGVQPNSTAGEGEYEDWASISVTGVSGTQENDTFAADTSLNSEWANNSASLTSLQLVPASAEPAYWVNWTLPAFGYALGTSDNIAGSTVASWPWTLPEYFNNYGGSGNGTVLPGIANQGSLSWVLVPSVCLPTTNGQPGGPIAPTGFFQLFNPPLQN